MFRKSLIVLAMVAAACTGSQGPVGPAGPAGDAGAGSTPGAPNLTATVAISSPANGSFFTTGERPVFTISFSDPGTTIPVSALAQAELFVYGPRDPLLTVTNVDLLNVPYAPFAAYAPLQGFPDGGPPNLVVNPDGSITYTLEPINIVTAGPIPPGQLPGTYTVSVLATSPGPASNAADAINQTFVLKDFQIGTATVEPYISGPADGGQVSVTENNSTCFACHENHATGGKVYMAHIAPAPPRTNVGNYNLDSLPIATCKSCHNNRGYSPNTLYRKVHGAHRGEHQLAPGAAHPDYGEVLRDDSLAAFLNVGFPLFPLSGGTPSIALAADSAMEKDCKACHVNNVWQTNFSRAACGTCHDNVFFAGRLPDGGVDPTATTGVIEPPTDLGQPATGPCISDTQCSALPAGSVLSIATCDTAAASPTKGDCLLKIHPLVTSDFTSNGDRICAICHASTNGGTSQGGTFAPVDTVHNITTWQPPITLDGYTFKNVTVTETDGGSGPFNVGETPVLSFQLIDNTGAPVTDLKTNATTPWSGTFLVAGPTSNPQRVYGTATGGLSMKATTTFNASTNTYTYSPPTPWPANALAPINTTLTPQPAPAGIYTVWFYWARTTNGIRDAVDAQAVVNFQTSGPVPPQGRQVVTQEACAACHGASTDGGVFFPYLAEHGGQRKNAETCNMCHSQYAQDFGVGSVGVACTTNAQCGGYDSANPADSWEMCNGTSCVVTVDPTPNVEIDLQKLVHSVHFARLREGFLEQGNLGEPWATPIIPPGTLNYLGFQNNLSNFQEVLAPVDVRSCTNCHADSNASCSATVPCAFGQSCSSSSSSAGTCTNEAWLNPTARACITCHDADDAFAHAALNTYTPPTGSPIEACNVCHGQGAEFAVDVMHNITSLYVTHLAYPREP